MKAKLIYILGLLLIHSTVANAKIVTKTVEYKQGDTILEGYLAYDNAIKESKPGVILVHDWMGLGDEVKRRTQEIAKLGYVAFAADIYGKGAAPKNSEEAGKLAGKYKNDRALMRARTRAAYDELSKQKNINNKKIVVMGYCFGGTAALELARSGADLVGTVSFHGGLQTPSLADAKNIKGKVLVLHGGDDPYVKDAEVLEFQKEMRDAKVDWQLISYGGAVHAFTNPGAGNDNSKGAAYNASADKRSWVAMKDFFKEIF